MCCCPRFYVYCPLLSRRSEEKIMGHSTCFDHQMQHVLNVSSMLFVCLFNCKRFTSLANIHRLSYMHGIFYFITSAISGDHELKNIFWAYRENKPKNNIFLFPHLYYVVIGYTFIKMLHVYVFLNTQYYINKYVTGVSLKKICTNVLSILPFSRMYCHRYFYLIWVPSS